MRYREFNERAFSNLAFQRRNGLALSDMGHFTNAHIASADDAFYTGVGAYSGGARSIAFGNAHAGIHVPLQSTREGRALRKARRHLGDDIASLGKRASSRLGAHYYLAPSGTATGAHLAYKSDHANMFKISTPLSSCSPGDTRCARDRAYTQWRQVA